MLSDNIGSSVPDFNPRSREGSDSDPGSKQPLPQISIRAPARGATMTFSISDSISRFQSALPRGERRLLHGIPLFDTFQSALPRGERRSSVLGAAATSYFNPRSREGSDSPNQRLPAIGNDFNPRSREGSDLDQFDPPGNHGIEFQSALPRGERPLSQVIVLNFSRFQSALPRGERHQFSPKNSLLS